MGSTGQLAAQFRSQLAPLAAALAEVDAWSMEPEFAVAACGERYTLDGAPAPSGPLKTFRARLADVVAECCGAGTQPLSLPADLRVRLRAEAWRRVPNAEQSQIQRWEVGLTADARAALCSHNPDDRAIVAFLALSAAAQDAICSEAAAQREASLCCRLRHAVTEFEQELARARGRVGS